MDMPTSELVTQLLCYKLKMLVVSGGEMIRYFEYMAG